MGAFTAQPAGLVRNLTPAEEATGPEGSVISTRRQESESRVARCQRKTASANTGRLVGRNKKPTVPNGEPAGWGRAAQAPHYMLDLRVQ